MGVKSHLCALSTMESARSHPASSGRSSFTMAATPAYAASTCIQIPCSSQMPAISGRGSMLAVEVVPATATTATGRTPAARSSSIAARRASGFIR